MAGLGVSSTEENGRDITSNNGRPQAKLARVIELLENTFLLLMLPKIVSLIGS